VQFGRQQQLVCSVPAWIGVCILTFLKGKAWDPRRLASLALKEFPVVFMSLLFEAWRDSLMSVERATLKISEVAVSTFKIFLSVSPECSLFIPYSSISIWVLAGILMLLRPLSPWNVSQTMLLCSFNFINSAHSLLLKLICFTKDQANLIVSFWSPSLLCCH